MFQLASTVNRSEFLVEKYILVKSSIKRIIIFVRCLISSFDIDPFGLLSSGTLTKLAHPMFFTRKNPNQGRLTTAPVRATLDCKRSLWFKADEWVLLVVVAGWIGGEDLKELDSICCFLILASGVARRSYEDTNKHFCSLQRFLQIFFHLKRSLKSWRTIFGTTEAKLLVK